MKQDSKRLVQLGQLLTESGLLTELKLKESLERARERKLPLGNTLVTMGCISQAELAAAVDLQAMINDNILLFEVAKNALTKLRNDGCDLEIALRKSGFNGLSVDAGSNRLGQLLIEAEMLTEEELGECLTASIETGMSLGKVLVFRRTLSDGVLLAVLSAQRLIRERMVDRHKAINGLKSVRKRKLTVDKLLATGGFYKAPERKSAPIGYLLVEAGFLKQDKLMLAVELSLASQAPIGEIMVEQGYISQELLDIGLQAQEVLVRSTANRDVVIAAIVIANKDGSDFPTALAKAGVLAAADGEPGKLVSELLVLCGLINVDETVRIPRGHASFADLMTALTSCGLKHDLAVNILRAFYLTKCGLLTIEEAVMAVHACRKMDIDIDRALHTIGWSASRRKF